MTKAAQKGNVAARCVILHSLFAVMNEHVPHRTLTDARQAGAT